MGHAAPREATERSSSTPTRPPTTKSRKSRSGSAKNRTRGKYPRGDAASGTCLPAVARAYFQIARTVDYPEGINVIRTRIQAPNANAHAERWVRTIRTDCLDRILILGRRH